MDLMSGHADEADARRPYEVGCEGHTRDVLAYDASGLRRCDDCDQMPK
jgi:hypothetical protein